MADWQGTHHEGTMQPSSSRVEVVVEVVIITLLIILLDI